MDQDPEAIKHDIEQTRERMGDTIEALAYKTDVPARAKDALDERVDSIKGAVSSVVGSARTALGGAAANVQARAADVVDAASDTRSSISDATAHARNQLPTGTQAKQRVRSMRSRVEQNPLGLAIGSIAAGFLIGSMLPVSDVERENIGPIGEKMVGSAKDAAANVVEQGKTAVTNAVSDAFSRRGS